MIKTAKIKRRKRRKRSLKPTNVPRAQPNSLRPDQVLRKNVKILLKKSEFEEYVLKIGRNDAIMNDHRYFVFLIPDIDELNNSQYVGVLNPKTGGLKLDEKSIVHEQSRLVYIIREAFNHIWESTRLPDMMKVKLLKGVRK